MHQDVGGRDADDDVIHDERARVGDEMNALWTEQSWLLSIRQMTASRMSNVVHSYMSIQLICTRTCTEFHGEFMKIQFTWNQCSDFLREASHREQSRMNKRCVFFLTEIKGQKFVFKSNIDRKICHSQIFKSRFQRFEVSLTEFENHLLKIRPMGKLPRG